MKLVIYAIHSEIVASRRANVTGLVDALKKSSLFEDVALTFVADAEPGTVSQDTVTKVTNFSRIPDGDAPEYFNSLLAPLHVRHVSNVLKHVAALRAIAGQFSADEDTFYMVVEDDVVYGDRIAPMLHELLGSLPAGG